MVGVSASPQRSLFRVIKFIFGGNRGNRVPTRDWSVLHTKRYPDGSLQVLIPTAGCRVLDTKFCTLGTVCVLPLDGAIRTPRQVHFVIGVTGWSGAVGTQVGIYIVQPVSSVNLSMAIHCR